MDGWIQVVEQVVYQLEGQWIDSDQYTKLPLMHPSAICVFVCVCV